MFLWPIESKYNYTHACLLTFTNTIRSCEAGSGHVVIFSAVDTVCFLLKRKLKLKICLGDGRAVEVKESKNKVLRLKMPAKLSRRRNEKNREKAKKKNRSHTHGQATHIQRLKISERERTYSFGALRVCACM